MEQFFGLLSNLYLAIFNTLDLYKFRIGGYNVSILGIILGFILLSVIITGFWKGGH